MGKRSLTYQSIGKMEESPSSFISDSASVRRKPMPTYEDVLTLAQQLSATEQARLAEVLTLNTQPILIDSPVELASKEAILDRIKARLQHIPSEVSLVDELIAERREAAKREEQS
jgi:hypothetical protein